MRPVESGRYQCCGLQYDLVGEAKMSLSKVPTFSTVIGIAFVSLLSAAPALAHTGVSASAGPIGTHNDHQSNYDLTNGDVQLNHSFVDVFATKPINVDFYASSSLQNAQLKALTTMSMGQSDGGVPGGSGGYRGNTLAGFSDKFYIQSSSDTPYLWSDTSNLNFNFDVSGLGEWSELKADAAGHTGLFTFLTFEVMGENGFYSRKEWLLGDVIWNDSMANLNSDVEVVNLGNTSNVAFQFNPGENFTWFLTLQTIIDFDALEENVYASLDFSHTVTAAYQGPQDSKTYSASGLFPGTNSLAPISAVPEPATWAMMIIGFGAVGSMVRTSRRRNAFAPA